MQICNAVAVAKLLNATLIIPHFHLNSVWKDPRCVWIVEVFEVHFPPVIDYCGGGINRVQLYALG